MDLERISSAQEGWTVVGSDGGDVGTVISVRQDQLVVEHGLINKQRLYVPVDAVAEVRDDEVVLDVPAGKVGEMGWHAPPSSPPPRGEEQTLPGGGDMTTMTGATFGAGGTVAAAGPMGPKRGDQIEDRFGGSGRAGLGMPGLAEDEEEVEPDVEGDTTRRPKE